MNVSIIDYGAGNIQSVKFALQRLGCEAIVTNNVQDLYTSDSIIFPGVGQAGIAMEKLRETGLDEIIPSLKQPFLGICVGMQLMCNFTEESNTKGLKIFDVNVTRFSGDLKIPQIGWNQIENLKTNLFNGLSEKDYMYFVNAYMASICNESIAISEYGTRFSSALAKDNFYGVQFHPEKSGTLGEKVLENFLKL